MGIYRTLKTYGDDDLGIIPIYIGVEGDEERGNLVTGTENYWCVNTKASEEDIQATLDFMNWCVTSDAGTKSMCKDMGFTIPLKQKMKSDNVLVTKQTNIQKTELLLYHGTSQQCHQKSGRTEWVLH